MRKSSLNRAHIRFSKEEYLKLLDESELTGESIPEILKAAYFGRGKLHINFSRDDATRIVTAINRVGNNLNQIARKTNSGFRSGFNPELEEIRNTLKTLISFTVGTYGDCKNKVHTTWL